MDFEIDKCYKHKHRKDLFVKVLGIDCRKLIDIKYSTGKLGKLIPSAPGWVEMTDKEWEKVEVIKEEAGE